MTSTLTKSNTKAASAVEDVVEEESAAPAGVSAATAIAAPAGQLAVIFTPEQHEACLQSCRGGSLAWAFGPVTNPTTLRINPGLNAPVSRELWAKAAARPETQVLLGRGLIQEIELADGTANADGEVSLAAVPVLVATRLIFGCRSTEQLAQWLRKEDRQPVREKLAARIKEIEDGRP